MSQRGTKLKPEEKRINKIKKITFWIAFPIALCILVAMVIYLRNHPY